MQKKPRYIERNKGIFSIYLEKNEKSYRLKVLIALENSKQDFTLNRIIYT